MPPYVQRYRPGPALKCIYDRCYSKVFQLALRTALPVRRGVELVRVGSRYGGWIVPLCIVREDATCYSGGVGEDASFDLALAEYFGCNVVAFDPTPRAIRYAESKLCGLPRLSFYPVGLWSKRGMLRFYAPKDPAHVSHSIVNLQRTSDFFFEAECWSIPDAMRELGHSRIDLLKLDIEGAEYEVLGSILDSGIDVSAVCVEFDQPTPVRRLLKQVRDMKRASYDLVAIDGWNYTFLRSSTPDGS